MKDHPIPPITPGLLRWAREEAGLSLSQAAARAKIGALKPRGESPGLEPWQRLKLWEEGEAALSYSQLESVAKAYRRPVLTFFLPAPPRSDSNLTDYRTVGDRIVNLKGSPEFAALIRRIEALHYSVKDIVIETGGGPVKFVGSGRADENIAAAVQQIRGQIGFSFRDQQGINNSERLFSILRYHIEEIGIFVLVEGNLGSHHSAIPADVFRGVVISDSLAPFIIVNPNDAPAARVFTLVHELAHLWLGDTGVSNFNALAKEQPEYVNNEKFCNNIAAEFLAPEKEIRDIWDSGINEHNVQNYISSFAKRFKVSEICIARRLLDLLLISSDYYWNFYKLYLSRIQKNKEKMRESEGGPDPTIQNKFRLGSKLIETVIDAAQEGRISELDASQMLKVKINNFPDIYSRAV